MKILHTLLILGIIGSAVIGLYLQSWLIFSASALSVLSLWITAFLIIRNLKDDKTADH